MPDHGALGDQAPLDLRGFVNGAQECLRTAVVPEPNAGEGVLGGTDGFHERRLVLPEHFHLARDRHSGVLRSAPEQSLPCSESRITASEMRCA